MTSNLERMSKDIDQLITRGSLLELAMVREIVGDEEFLAILKENIAEEKAKRGQDAFDEKATLKANLDLPDFKSEYDAWYTEALALIAQVLPSRLQDFRSFYEKPKGRKQANYSNYVMQDYLQSLRVTLGGDVLVQPRAALPQFKQQLAIVKAAKSRFSSSLFDIRQIVQGELFDREIDAARELLKHKFTRAAGVMAGVVLERHLREVCDAHSIKISKKNPGVADLNEALKSGAVIGIPEWRHISLLGDLRNLCAHNKDREPTVEQVGDLIDGTDKVLKTIA